LLSYVATRLVYLNTCGTISLSDTLIVAEN
jgi:hypothetical protein